MVHPRIALITVLTSNVPAMRAFYEGVLGFPIKTDMEQYIEFQSEGVRFSLCDRAILADATQHSDYAAPPSGQSFELAFPCDQPEDVDQAYQKLVAAGATPVKPPETMPWGQRTAFFADPDGNIHELFADLPAAGGNGGSPV